LRLEPFRFHPVLDVGLGEHKCQEASGQPIDLRM